MLFALVFYNLNIDFTLGSPTVDSSRLYSVTDTSIYKKLYGFHTVLLNAHVYNNTHVRLKIQTSKSFCRRLIKRRFKSTAWYENRETFIKSTNIKIVCDI